MEEKWKEGKDGGCLDDDDLQSTHATGLAHTPPPTRASWYALHEETIPQRRLALRPYRLTSYFVTASICSSVRVCRSWPLGPQMGRWKKECYFCGCCGAAGSSREPFFTLEHRTNECLSIPHTTCLLRKRRRMLVHFSRPFDK